MPTRKRPAPAPAPKGPPADVGELLHRLGTAIPSPQCELDHQDPWTLLIATILSAQSTDRTVNTVTPVLWKKWPTPTALAAAPREEVEEVVHRTGFFRNKAKAIQECSLVIAEQHGGEVPRDMASLVKLPGVARKTANVVLGVAFRLAEGIVVDTHVMRVAQRLGLSTATLADKVENELCARLPREQWIDGGHRLLLLGRYVCLAKAPACQDCPLAEICPSRQSEPLGSWEERARHTQERVESRGTEGSGSKPA
ncbi:MAG: endonuclease III [Planctomycetota bacterium]|nr:endonuclease III [Planctomycetota bacterium]